ncbi:MAG: hypothetical protein WBQ08_17270 [Candidatus Sulfotelmatobacter sp.]
MRWKVIFPIALTLLGLAAGTCSYLQSTPALTGKEAIVVADFAKTAVGRVFDGAFRQAVAVQLKQPASVSLVSEERIKRILRLTGRTGGLLLAGLGLLPLYGAFQNYRKFRILERTPTVPIRNLAEGLVHIRGKAAGQERRTSPITQLPCFYYQVKVEHEIGSPHDGQWSMCLRDTDHVKFYLQDATGKVRIDLHQSQLDLSETFQARTGPGPLFGRNAYPSPGGSSAPSEHELLDYLSRTNARIHAELAAERESKVHAIMNAEGSVSLLPAVLPAQESETLFRSPLLFTEQCLLPDCEYNILGTCVENPSPTDQHDRYMIVRGQQEHTFLISNKPEPAMGSKLRQAPCFSLSSAVH